ncbi:MAG: transposase [Burkholderiales bacterium]|nr:MAG: transposase [Burkholderiales bacterium]
METSLFNQIHSTPASPRQERRVAGTEFCGIVAALQVIRAGYSGSVPGFPPCWDGTGVWLAQRRLHRGRFLWPRADDALCVLSREQWAWLTQGVDWQRLSAQARAAWQV